MGNCCRHESSMTWGGEDWGTSESDAFSKERSLEKINHEEKKMKNNNDMFSSENTDHNKNEMTNSSTDQVKIRITKKQLEELLGKIDVQGVPVEQLLAQLMNGGATDVYHAQQRSWRPALQSIPEVN